jgi:hypothetical protein
MIEALSSSETLVLTRATQHYIPDDAILVMFMFVSKALLIAPSASKVSKDANLYDSNAAYNRKVALATNTIHIPSGLWTEPQSPTYMTDRGAVLPSQCLQRLARSAVEVPAPVLTGILTTATT